MLRRTRDLAGQPVEPLAGAALVADATPQVASPPGESVDWTARDVKAVVQIGQRSSIGLSVVMNPALVSYSFRRASVLPRSRSITSAEGTRLVTWAAFYSGMSHDRSRADVVSLI
jgi:hypothetical protein